MKAYFEPKMNISVFDTENIITTSGETPTQQPTGNQYGVVDYGDLASTNEVTASKASMTD